MIRSRLLFGAALAAAVACEPTASTAPVTPGVPALALAGSSGQYVRVTPDTAYLSVGGTVKLTGWAVPPYGAPYDYSYVVVWASLDPAIATVATAGNVRAVANGRARIVATLDGTADTTLVIVGGATTTATPTSPWSEVAVRITPDSVVVAAGASAKLTASVILGDGTAKDQSYLMRWTSLDTTIAKVDEGGYVRARRAGRIPVIATKDKLADTAIVVVPGIASPSAPPAQASDVALTLRRFAVGSGLIRATGGIPLRAGQLRAADLSLVRVFVAGREVPIYAEALSALHPDGSLRSVYLELDADLSTAPVAAILSIGTRRLAGDLARGSVAARGQPAAAVLASSPDYLVSTGIVGRTLTAAQTTALGGAFATWESRFAPTADLIWAREAARWEGDYYDRAHLYFAAWARTGNAEYFRRAAAIAVAYRRDYLEANNYGASPHWAQLDGLADHYLLTGDEASRVAVGRTAGVLSGYLPTLGDVTSEARIQARLLTAFLLSERIAAPGRSAAEWGSLLDSGVEKVLASQRADGSFRFAVGCYESQNYMSGMLNDALSQVYDYHRADSRIVGAVRRSLDFLWNTQLVTSPSVTFKYISAYCANVGSPDPSPDLNGLMVSAFGWLYRQTGDATYRSRGDMVFAGINAAWIDGSKQFNQSYSQSYNVLGFR